MINLYCITCQALAQLDILPLDAKDKDWKDHSCRTNAKEILVCSRLLPVFPSVGHQIAHAST
jgi:hypothetical protein